MIDPKDWESFSEEQQQTYHLVNEFSTEQEADKFAVGQLVLAMPVRPKIPKKPKLATELTSEAPVAP